MKTWVKTTLTIGLCLIPAGLIVGFSNSWSNKTPISAVGSSSVKPFLENLSDLYMKGDGKNDDITVEAGGSGFGIEQIADGLTNIGNASKDPYETVMTPEKQGDTEGKFRQKWIDNKIKTITIAWEGICNVFIPPKGLDYNGDINELLSVNDENITNYFRIFSGINDGFDWTDKTIAVNSMYHFVNPSITIDQHDQYLLKNTLITPFVRGGGSQVSGTADSFIKDTHIHGFIPFDDGDKKSKLSLDQQIAFKTGKYGTSFGLSETGEPNSMAWDKFQNNNKNGSIVYLSSGFVSQPDNSSIIKKRGYGIIAYEGKVFETKSIDEGYNWYRPLTCMISVKNQNSPEIKFLKNIFKKNYLDILALGAQPIYKPEDIFFMFPHGFDADWKSDNDLGHLNMGGSFVP